MCGIIGYVGDKVAAPLLLDSLRRLEYRGYDSAGIATIGEGLKIKKDQGKIDEIHDKHDLGDLEGTVGIAHTRWSTHGIPSKENAHPHTCCKGEIVVVHNGIIENHVELRKELQKKGHKFRSDTDTEILPHLIEEYYSNGFEEAVRKALEKVEGSFGALMISTKEPGSIIAARRFSPLVLGLGNQEYFAASDVPAFLEHTNKVVYMRDGEYAILRRDGVVVKAIKSGEEVAQNVEKIDWSVEMAEKGGYQHFTIKEIHEQAEAVADTLRMRGEVEKAAKEFAKVKRFYVVACGTSYHAGLILKHLFEKLLGLGVEVVTASEFKTVANVVGKNTGIIAITQSGETADTLAAVRRAKEKGAKTFAITNVLGSSITRECDVSVYTCAGPEIGVVATKTFVTQLVIAYLLVKSMAKLMSKKVELSGIEKTPKLIEETLRKEGELKKLIDGQLAEGKTDFYFLGRGVSYPIALEGALKLKEISYLHAEGFAAGELKHGPLALVEDGTPVVCIVPPGEDYKKSMGNVQEVLARGANAILFTSEKDEGQSRFQMPEVPEILTPLVYIVPLQIMAYYAAVNRGLDPDKPRNLAKSVTVE